MTDAKRTQLKKKVEAGQARNQDRGRTTIVDRAGEAAIEAKDKFTAFAKEHPITTIAGGVALGILVSTLFKRSPTRKLGGKAAKRAGSLAAMGAELAFAYAQQAMETANEAGRAGAKRLDGIGDTARNVGRDAAHRAGDAGDAALALTREAGKRLGKAIRNRIN
jgi:hypothetical protein